LHINGFLYWLLQRYPGDQLVTSPLKGDRRRQQLIRNKAGIDFSFSFTHTADMKEYAITFLLLLLFISSFGQVFNGSVIDLNSNEPLAYVNIGILRRGIGTVSDEEGKFTLTLDDQFNADTLRISMIGFKTRDFIVSDFKKQFTPANAVIAMSRSVTELHEVTIKPVKIKYASLGNDFSSKSVVAGFHSNKLGSELGTVMRIKNAPSYIEKVSFNIGTNKYDSAIWRVNIYLLKDGKPGENILTQPVYLKSYKNNENLSIDLSKYLLEVNDDFVVALELIDDLGIGGLNFCAGFFGNATFARDASQGEWVKIPVGVGFNATVSYGY
jgi:hypothetical protein